LSPSKDPEPERELPFLNRSRVDEKGEPLLKAPEKESKRLEKREGAAEKEEDWKGEANGLMDSGSMTDTAAAAGVEEDGDGVEDPARIS